MNIFEGYVGIRLWDGQLVDDVIFSLLLFLFILFPQFYDIPSLVPFKYRPDCGRQDIRICELCGMAGGFIGDRNGFLCFIPVLSV